MPAEEEHRDSVGVDNTGGLHEQVQGGQQECGGNTGGVGKLRNIYWWMISNPLESLKLRFRRNLNLKKSSPLSTVRASYKAAIQF